MSTTNNNVISIEVTINAPLSKVWQYWTSPAHIVNWNFALEEWHSPKAENNLTEGGTFNYRMEAKDGSMGFDYSGKYDKVDEHQYIALTLDDERKVTITFTNENGQTHIKETFETENTHPEEMQRTGWQNILNNFKSYVEAGN